MVKLKAPMLSLDASGKLADAIVFAKWKGRHYARALVTPSNPRSAGQTGMRRMLKFLSQDWTNLTTAAQDSWNDRADADVISQFNAFMGFNLKRWRNFSAPTKTEPCLQEEPVGTVANEAATAGVRQILIEFDITASANNWGVMVFRQITTPVVTAWTNLVQIVWAGALGGYSWIDTPLSAGHYYYNFRPFSIDGLLGAQCTEVDDTVV